MEPEADPEADGDRSGEEVTPATPSDLRVAPAPAVGPAQGKPKFLFEGLAGIQFEEEWRFSEYRKILKADAWGESPPERAWSTELPLMYLDTSALLKLYKPEPGSSLARKIERHYGEHFGSSSLALPEVVNGIWDHKKRGPGGAQLEFEDRLSMYRRFLSHLATRRLVLLPMDEEVLMHLPAVAKTHPRVRGQDLIHMTTVICLRARRTLRGLGGVMFASSDADLCDAVALEGFDPFRLEKMEDKIVAETLEKMMEAVDSGQIPLKPGLERDKAKELIEKSIRLRMDRGE